MLLNIIQGPLFTEKIADSQAWSIIWVYTFTYYTILSLALSVQFSTLLARVSATIKQAHTKYWLLEVFIFFFAFMEINGVISVPRSCARRKCRK